LLAWLTRTYRGFFVDLQAITDTLPVDQARKLLNIGTGDGMLLNHLARRFPSLQITSSDITEEQGWLIEDDIRARVSLVTLTPEKLTTEGFGGPYDAVLLCDVIHHVPVSDRYELLAAAWPCVDIGGVLIAKDVEPGGVKATLALLSDRYVTGDRHTRLIGMAEMTALLGEVSHGARVEPTDLLSRDYPNYMLSVSRGPSPPHQR